MRILPDKVLGGYANWGKEEWASSREKILKAAEDGVNVIFWFTIDLVDEEEAGKPVVRSRGPDGSFLSSIANELKARNLHTTHLITIGGWNEVHPTTLHAPEEVYAAWKKWNEEEIARPEEGFDGFDGFDWDIEGNDEASSKYNTFDVETLDWMGRISQLAKQDGYIVSMAPCESYLDPTSHAFDRSLTATHAEWQPIVPHFTYHGTNAYAYLLSRYGFTKIEERESESISVRYVHTFDMVMLQLYESYSHANFELTLNDKQPGQWLSDLVQRFSDGWLVQFSSDEAVGYGDAIVKVLPSQLVLGLANAWAQPCGNPPCKTLFLHPHVFESDWQHSSVLSQVKGFAFWTIKHEGEPIIVGEDRQSRFYMAAELNKLLRVRGNESSEG